MNVPSYRSSILLTRAYRVLRARVYKCLEEFELNPTEWSLIGTVYESKDGVRLAQVAAALGVKAPLVTLLVDNLVKRDILKRIPNQVDARAKLLVITPNGKVLVKTVERTLNRALLPLLGDLSEQDLLTYQKVLEVIIKNEASQ
jgi:DNA-binding MarR family transcriptional regulator